MELTARLTTQLDQFEDELPRLPASILRLNRSMVHLVDRSVSNVASVFGDSFSAVGSVASGALRTVTGQTRRGVEDTLDVAGNRAKTAAGQARRGVEDTVDTARTGAKTAAGQARRGVEDTVDTARTRAKTAAGQAGAQTARVADKAQSEAERLADRAEDAADSKPGSGVRYEDWNRSDLYDRAQELDVEGRSGMSKAQLIKALRAA